MAAPTPHLVDEILEEIFLRLPTPAALARASTACPRFRRIITDRPFLRRYRKRHPPPLLGLVSRGYGFFPMEAPDPSAPLARALADAADFTYSFLPECFRRCTTRDARDGRVLVEEPTGYVDRASITIANLAVCDPLSRRYVLLPPIPKEMTAQQDRLVYSGSKLAHIGEDEDETSFKVVCTAHYKSKLVVFVFSSVTGQWCIAASTSWSSLGTVSPGLESLFCSNYVRGCLYWADLWRDKLLVLDTGIMEFSTVDVLTGYHVQLRNRSGQSRVYRSFIVDGTKGALEMLTLTPDESFNLFHLYHTTQQNNGGSSNEWQLKNVMELPRRRQYFTAGETEGFLFLQDFPGLRDDNVHGLVPEDNLLNFYSLEVKTFELKKICMTKDSDCAHSYFGFPPSLSKPSL